MKEFRTYRLPENGGPQLVSYSNTPDDTLQNGAKLTIDKPASYSIRVIGELDQGWSDRLGGLTITCSSQEGKQTITTLSGSIIDQAALFGVLKALYVMRLPLLSVEYMEII
jgi:hypothetical protein